MSKGTSPCDTSLWRSEKWTLSVRSRQGERFSKPASALESRSRGKTCPYGKNGALALYAGAQGNPKVYYSSTFSMLDCGYDNKGRLYLSVYDVQTSGDELARLGRNGSIGSIALDAKIYSGLQFSPSVQWDGERITISSYPEGNRDQKSGAVSVFQLHVIGSRATVTRTTTLNSAKDYNHSPSWIDGKYMASVYYFKGEGRVGSWAYPQGGMAAHEVKVQAGTQALVTGVTLSSPNH
ncbi:MAG TPA: hypothetical protein VIX83_03760 [Candidatus Cybelea sp.]